MQTTTTPPIGTSIESLIGNLIGGQEALLHALGVTDSSSRAMQPRPSAVVRRITERRQLSSFLAAARTEASLLIADQVAAAPWSAIISTQTLNLLSRGVGCRILLNPGAHQEDAFFKWGRQVQDLGGEMRWIAEEFKPMILVDSKSALIPEDSGSAGALLITEPALVTVLARVFGNAWNSAERLADADPAPQGLATSASIRESIIEMLISGSPDKTIARHLGISLRSVQAHVATLRTELGASTRAQLGYLLGRASLNKPGCRIRHSPRRIRNSPEQPRSRSAETVNA